MVSSGTQTSAVGDSGAVVGQIIDANQYMVLATADAEGRPWASPVWFAHEGYVEFFWVSSPEVTHSRNIAVRPQIGIVIFNSQVQIGTGQGVYMTAVAEQVSAPDLIERGLDIFTRRSLVHGGREWTAADVQDADGLLLYRAVADGHSILAKDGKPDHRIPVDIQGSLFSTTTAVLSRHMYDSVPDARTRYS